MFSEERAREAVNFFERFLTHTKGIYARKPFFLADWQREHVRELFGRTKRDGTRQYSTSYWEVSKKNGKSEIAAGIALYGLVMDGEEGAEVYSAAATRDQAALVFRVAAQMVRNHPELNALCRVIDSTKTIYLRDDPNCFYRAVSADGGTQDGVNPHFVIFDELHRQKGRDLWDVLKLGMSTRSQPLLFAITTAGVASKTPLCWEQHEYARQIREKVFRDPSFYPVVYSLEESEDWTVEGKPAAKGRSATGWYKANPALGIFKKLEAMREDCEQAKRIPGRQNSFRRFNLNQWVTDETRWISMREWDACGEPFDKEALLGKPCIGALDLSTSQDITAFALLFEDAGVVTVLPEFWIPGDNLHERCIRDRVPYDRWVADGLIHLTPGNAVDYAAVRKRISELGEQYEIREIAHDPWNATQVCIELAGEGFTMVPMRQGFITLSAPSKELERRVLTRTIRHGKHPVLRWMMDCCAIRQDPAGNIKPVKPDRSKSGKRIDGIVALIMGLDRIVRHQADIEPQIAFI